VGASPRFVAIGDLNSDGKPDLVAANSGGTTVSILLGTGTGTFGSQTTYPVGTNPYSVAIGDLNGDGKPDLVVANTGGTTASVLLGTGTGTFGTQTTYPVGASPYSAAMSDLNGDGKLDLAVANYSNNTASILLGKGDGTFGTQTTYPVGANPYFVAMSDLNGDGKLDLAVANVGSSTVSILINTTMMLAIPTVTFGGISATSVQFVNSSAITATTPAHAFGPVDVVVKNADGQSATLSGGYTYNAPPGIVSVTPSSVLKTGGDAVTISGFNFFASSTVSFGGVSAQSVTYVNSSTLSVVTPVQNTGTYNVVVTNPDGQIATLTNGITFMNPPPSVISIAPNNGSAAGGTSVTITGSGFVPPNSGGSTGWTAATGTLPATLVYSHLAVIGNNIYLFGGNASGSLAKSIYVAPVSNPTAWTIATGTLPATLSDSDLVVIGSNIYLFGGYAAGVFTKAIYVASVSNPTVWTTATGTLPTTLGDAQSAVIGSNIYFFGGYASGYTSTIYVAPVSNPTAWTIATGTIPATVVYSQLAVIGSHIYLFGGYNGVGYTKAIYTASISNPTVWTTATGTLPTTLSGSQLAVIGSNIYLFGGIASSSATNAIYTASISNPTVWTTATGTLPATLYYSQSAVIGNNIYLFGGIASSSATKAIYTAPATNNQSTVTIGGVAATNINFANTTTITASTTAHAVGPVDVVVTNYDGQSSTLSGGYTYNPDRIAIISSSLNQQEGQPGMMTVQAQDVNGNAGPVATDTVVQLSSTAATGFFARNINEDISTRWNYNSVVIPAGQSSVNFYYMDNLKGTPTISVSSAVIITGASQQETITSKYRFLVVGATNPVKQGIPSSITVQAIDYNGIPLAGYAGTMRFTATDARAIVPSNFAITPAMLGGYTFVNGVTMLTQGTWCVTATDVSDANITGSQCGIVVTPPNTGVAAQLAIITSPQFISTTGTSTPITVQMQDASGTPSISNTTTTIYIFSDSATASYSANGTIGWRAQPLTLTIPAGASSINFFYRDSTIGTHILTAGDDATQGADFGLINAAQTETITVGDAYSISVSAALHSINAGSSTAVTMTLHDSAGNIVSSAINQPIYLSGTNGAQVATSSAGPWSSILGTTIGVGQTAVTAYVSNTTAGAFTITASDNNPADGATGLIDGTDRVTVAPGLPTTFAFTTSMFQMTAGQVSAAITVAMWDQFGNAATSTTGTKLYLFADQPGALFSANAGFSSTATNVTIPAGQSNVTFYLKQSIYGAATTTITVSDNAVAPDGAAGIADVAQAESIIPGAMYQFVITSSSPIAAVAGAQTPVVAFIKNSYGVVIPFSSATTIYLRTTSVASLAQFSAQPDPSWLPITSIVAPIGTTSTLFYYEDTGAGNPVITIADEPTGSDTGIVNATAQFAIVSSAPSALTFTTQPFSIQAGEVSPALTVRTQDQYGNAVTKTTSTLVAITSTSGGGGFDTSSGGVFAKTNITIPAGQSTATFYYKDVIVGTSTITAFASGFTSATQGEIVTAGTVAALHLLIGSSTIMAGTVAGPITATFINGFGVVIPAPSNVMVNVSSSAASGFFDTNPIGAFDGGATSVFIPQNATSVIFYYRDTKAGLATVTASGLGFAGTLVLAISPGAANSLAITSAPFSIQVGQVSPQMTVLLQDQYGNTASSSAPLFLIPTTTSGVGKFATSSSGSFTATQIKIPAGQTSVSMPGRRRSP
jgi:hypothetical protein